jgi:ABC-type Fe3+-hydroxamate transport system substrate-binding protein
MCAHVTEQRNHGVCACGFRPPFAGSLERDGSVQVVAHYAGLANRTAEAKRLRKYIEHHVSPVTERTVGVERPAVYFALGHPLIAIFGDKFECNLMELVGGRCVNREIERDDRGMECNAVPTCLP